MPSFIFQFQLVSGLDEFFKPETPAKLFRPKATKVIPTKSDFLNDFFLSLRNFPLFCSTIRISPLSVGLEPGRKLNNSNTSQAKWFSCIFLDRGKYTVEYAWEMCYSTLQKVADPKKNISIHKIPFVGEECPIKKKRRKRWINFVLERRKMWVPGNKFYFGIQVQQYRCLNLDVNCYYYFPLLTYIN